ncbi:hypothetical protein [Bradyrhizobium sp.]|uniref:hypothetical protein n=1 Tax=Bradyrhizobium sp. TaxID=376 RepID=UPI0007C8A562|nr:hypothetical protein [Bradyrhizobium sp.]
MIDIFEDCGLARDAGEKALDMLRSLVRGYVLHEIMHTFVDVVSYDVLRYGGTRVRDWIVGSRADVVCSRAAARGGRSGGRARVPASRCCLKLERPRLATFVLRADFEPDTPGANT